MMNSYCSPNAIEIPEWNWKYGHLLKLFQIEEYVFYFCDYHNLLELVNSHYSIQKFDSNYYCIIKDRRCTITKNLNLISNFTSVPGYYPSGFFRYRRKSVIGCHDWMREGF